MIRFFTIALKIKALLCNKNDMQLKLVKTCRKTQICVRFEVLESFILNK